MQYGKMSNEPGLYILNKIPECGNFEYIYKNKNIFLKVDQFGPSLIQQDPPAGMFVLQRKERETFSAIKYYFKDGNKVVHNFDIYTAKKFEIRYFPYKAEYELHFNQIDVLTTICLDNALPIIHINIKVNSKTKQNVQCLEVACFDPIDTSMAIWDKKEWYYSTDVDELNNPLYKIKHYSVDGKHEDRRNIIFLQDVKASSLQNSLEKLRHVTKNFTKIPTKISINNLESVVCYDQVAAARFEIENGSEINALIKVTDDNETIDKNDIIKLLSKDHFSQVISKSKDSYINLINKRSIETSDIALNNFVNNYLPLELSWVTDLDRGWPTGMRGSRDCANDFLGYLSYDLAKCRDVISTLLNNLRYEDGWFPRQIPFNGSNKYDLRPFSDSGAFVMELIYEYLCYSNDFSILDETFTYLNSDKKGSGIEHYIKAAQYYTLPQYIGEHGLIKLSGGDWLDCLNRVGLKGRGESVMVTCQAVLAFRQINEVLNKYGEKYSKEIKTFEAFSKKFINNIKKYSYIDDEKFYRAIFADDGNWYFSEKDIDGNKRVYIPTNAYTMIAKVNPSNDKKVIATINALNESKYGFKLFTTPFGNPPMEGIGKMGTGDFAPYMFENGAVYNHGGNLFYARALATVGDYKSFYKAFNYALPYNPKFHPENISYLPSYACTNVYNLIPTFRGRSGLCFLTGSIAMIERAIYNWMFGLDYHIDYLAIKPCIPKQYKDAIINETYNEHKITITYQGFGNKIVSAKVNNKTIQPLSGTLILDKEIIKNGSNIYIRLK